MDRHSLERAGDVTPYNDLWNLLVTDREAWVEKLTFEQSVDAIKRTQNPGGQGNREYSMMLVVYKDYTAEQQREQQRREMEERRLARERMEEHRRKKAIEDEAKRRIEQEQFEEAVRMKILELKGLR